MNPAAAQTATSASKERHGDILLEMEEMLRELNAEIAAMSSKAPSRSFGPGLIVYYYLPAQEKR